MKKGVLYVLVGTLFLLSACGKKEIVTQPIPDVTEQYNYKESTVLIIDAIVDTEAEMQYIDKIQQEYAKLANSYNTSVARSSGLTSNAAPQAVENMQKGIQSLVTDLEKFQYRISTINLPDFYKQTLATSIGAYVQSLNDENMRLSGGEENENPPSAKLYQQADEANKKVQKAYQEIRQS